MTRTCYFAVNLAAKVTANPRARKEKLVDDIQNAVDEYDRVFVFEFDNMRSNYFKQLRVEWGKSRLVLSVSFAFQYPHQPEPFLQILSGQEPCDAACSGSGYRE